MKIIWQLFGVHIVLIIVILTLLLAGIIWPRRYRKVRRSLFLASGVCLLGSIILGLITYWPYTYKKNYLTSDNAPASVITTLRQLADPIGFNIGVAIAPEPLYYENVGKEFNSVVATNHFKPGKLLKDPLNWEFDFSKADELLEFAESNGMRMRGHTLVWGKFAGRTFPKAWINEVNSASDQEKAMKGILKRYIVAVMDHFKGHIPVWDVVNEPMAGEGLYPSIFTKSLGEKYIDYAFQIARETDPDCLLFLNEQIGDYQGPQGQAFISLLKRLLDRDVPIDGVGLQTHHINRIHDIEGLKQFIRQIGQLGLQVEITELDVRLLLFKGERDPYQAQGDQFKAIVKTCLDDPACKGVTFWGLTDKSNWMDAVPPFKWKSPNAPNIFDEEMRKKPGYHGVWEVLKEARELASPMD